MVSAEGGALVERQTAGLFGDLSQLQAEMRAAVGDDAGSLEELMQRVQGAVAEEKVQVLTMTVHTQRRLVLEAVAFGAFLRDVEEEVDTNFGVLTYNPGSMPYGGPGMLPPSDD